MRKNENKRETTSLS